MGDLEKSEVHAGCATKPDPQNYAPHYLLGRILAENGSTGRRGSRTRGRRPSQPSNADAHLSLAEAYQRAGNNTLAEARDGGSRQKTGERISYRPASKTKAGSADPLV
jgi:hypothetical protein